MVKKRLLARFFSNVYWFLIQGRTGLKESFEDVYNIENCGPTFRQIYIDTFGDEYAKDVDPCGFTTKTDLENLKKCLKLEKDELLADLACGRGGNGLYIARELAVRLKGLDLSEKAVVIARKRIDEFNLQGRAEFVSGDMRELPYENNKFDAAMCVDTLYMVPDKQAALTEVARVLKSNRVFAVLTWEMHIPFAVKDYRPLFEECGLQVDSYDEVPGWYERQKGIFEGFLKHQDALTKEMGTRTAAFWINGAKTELPKIDKMRRVFIVARRR